MEKEFSSMSSVVIDKKDLLKIINDNKLEHERAFNDAKTAYLEVCKVELNKGFDKLKEKLKEVEDGNIDNVSISIFPSVTKPENHVKDYSKVIKMLELSVDDKFSLRNDEFSQYVMDDWAWKPMFLSVASGCISTNNFYSNGGK